MRNALSFHTFSISRQGRGVKNHMISRKVTHGIGCCTTIRVTEFSEARPHETGDAPSIKTHLFRVCLTRWFSFCIRSCPIQEFPPPIIDTPVPCPKAYEQESQFLIPLLLEKRGEWMVPDPCGGRRRCVDKSGSFD